jgi:hypothetical protein
MKPIELEVRLTFKVERDEPMSKYVVVVRAHVVGQPMESSDVRFIEIPDKVVAEVFEGNKDLALDTAMHNNLSQLLREALKKANKKKRFILS